MNIQTTQQAFLTKADVEKAVRDYVEKEGWTVVKVFVSDEVNISVHLDARVPQQKSANKVTFYDRNFDNGCSICRNPNCDNPCGQH